MVLISEKRNPTDPFSFSNTLSGRPHHLQKPSFTALSLRGIFMLSFIHKTHALGSLFLIVVRRNYWYEPQFSRISPKIFTFRLFIKNKKL